MRQGGPGSTAPAFRIREPPPAFSPGNRVPSTPPRTPSTPPTTPPPVPAPPATLAIVDDGRGQWGPLGDLRAAFEIRAGVLTHRQRIERALGLDTAALFVPDELAPLVAQRESVPVNPPRFSPPRDDRTTLLVSGRWPGDRAVDRVRALQPGEAVVDADGALVAARLPAGAASPEILRDLVDRPTAAAAERRLRVHRLAEARLMGRPWEAVVGLAERVAADLDDWPVPPFDPGELPATCVDPAAMATIVVTPAEAPHAFRVAPTARLGPFLHVRTDQGPVVVDSHASVESMVVLEGPCYVGPGARVGAHAHLRPGTVIGAACRVAGEVSNSILYSYTNKAHAGYLGHSIVGHGVNLGAMTTVSNLKNTYGPVRVQLTPDGPVEDTDQPFVGPLIGDYVRTAIGTRLLTGSVVGCGSMLAVSSYPPKCVGRFRFLTDRGDADYTFSKFLDTARHMMTRRHRGLRDAEVHRLRQLAGVDT